MKPQDGRIRVSELVRHLVKLSVYDGDRGRHVLRTYWVSTSYFTCPLGSSATLIQNVLY